MADTDRHMRRGEPSTELSGLSLRLVWSQGLRGRRRFQQVITEPEAGFASPLLVRVERESIDG